MGFKDFGVLLCVGMGSKDFWYLEMVQIQMDMNALDLFMES